MAGPDHRDNLIISVLHSIPQSGNGEARGFTFASTHLIQGAVDRAPHTQRTEHGQSFRRSSWNSFCPACGFVFNPQWRNAPIAVFSPLGRVPLWHSLLFGYNIPTLSPLYLRVGQRGEGESGIPLLPKGRSLLPVLDEGKPDWIRELQKKKRPWEDHVSHEDEYFFSEPYHLAVEDIEDLTKFTKENDLEFVISGAAVYHPDCLLIKIWKEEDEELKT